MNIFESVNELTVLFENRSNLNEIQYSSDLPCGFEISDTSLEARVPQFYRTNFLFISFLGQIRAACEIHIQSQIQKRLSSSLRNERMKIASVKLWRIIQRKF